MWNFPRERAGENAVRLFSRSDAVGSENLIKTRLFGGRKHTVNILQTLRGAEAMAFHMLYFPSGIVSRNK